MFDSPTNPEGESELRDIEALLRQVVPAPSQLDERELFYQAGYAAQTGSVPANFTSSNKGRGVRALLYSFSGGLGAGIAASWLLFLSFGMWMTPKVELRPDALLVKNAEVKANSEAEIGNTEKTMQPALDFPALALDWDENSIRTVLFRGNRRAIWGARESELQPLESSTNSLPSEEVTQEINNLNWRRASESSWLD